ncbi:MAG: DUF2203 family protein [Deferribacteres bacterium]|nr:DUF2203 family protein [candidate division KSB1 bacterium]MCB9509300.1 DUF2203 family protein [Deferribacteres bacterium]
MNVNAYKKFTLEQANALIPELIRLTQCTMKKLKIESAKWHAEETGSVIDDESAYHQRLNRYLRQWADQVTRLGVMPKGYFTCDFVSPNPERLFCWNYGETEICFTHKTSESFKDRIPLDNPELQGFEVSLN